MSLPCKTCGAARTSPCSPNCGKVAKQVIVMRKDLNMRKGKMIAQGAHASLGAVWVIQESVSYSGWHEAFRAWKDGAFTKVCVSVNSLEDLVAIRTAAIRAGLPYKFIVDSGATEFHGVPTPTCLAIGPCWAADVDPITGHLPLL